MKKRSSIKTVHLFEVLLTKSKLNFDANERTAPRELLFENVVLFIDRLATRVRLINISYCFKSAGKGFSNLQDKRYVPCATRIDFAFTDIT